MSARRGALLTPEEARDAVMGADQPRATADDLRLSLCRAQLAACIEAVRAVFAKEPTSVDSAEALVLAALSDAGAEPGGGEAEKALNEAERDRLSAEEWWRRRGQSRTASDPDTAWCSACGEFTPLGCTNCKPAQPPAAPHSSYPSRQAVCGASLTMRDLHTVRLCMRPGGHDGPHLNPWPPANEPVPEPPRAEFDAEREARDLIRALCGYIPNRYTGLVTPAIHRAEEAGRQRGLDEAWQLAESFSSRVDDQAYRIADAIRAAAKKAARGGSEGGP